MGQTEFDIMDLEDQKLLEREMLTLLGLTHVPENAVHKVKRTKLYTVYCTTKLYLYFWRWTIKLTYIYRLAKQKMATTPSLSS